MKKIQGSPALRTLQSLDEEIARKRIELDALTTAVDEKEQANKACRIRAIANLVEAGFTQKDIAATLDLSTGRVSQIIKENDIKKPTASNPVKQAIKNLRILSMRMEAGQTILTLQEIADLKKLEMNVQRLRDNYIRAAREQGIAVKDIAEHFDISTARISQITKAQK